jgi:tripartite-type tricarboxylate transporter receptor subunit TctC
MTQRRTVLQSAAAWAIPFAGAPAFAAPWPSKPLRIIVPFAPGGSSDFIARLISKPLGDALGTTVIVENKTGANGVIGAAATAQADDGHTMLLSDMSSIAISPLVTKEMPYRPEQLKGATMLAYSPHLLVAHPSVPASNMAELVAYSKKKSLNVSSAGSGSANHLGVVDIALRSGLQWQHVPFRGGAAALADTAAGNTQLCLNGMLATMPLVTAGRLKLIGVSKATRMALIGDVPTIAEQGVKGFESGTYQGIAIPASLPKATAEKLAAALIAVIRSPDIRARLVGAGAEVMTTSPKETTDFLANEAKRWASVIQNAGKQLEGNA